MAFPQAGDPALGVPTINEDVDMLSDTGITHAESLRDYDLDMLDDDYMLDEPTSERAATDPQAADHFLSASDNLQAIDATAEELADDDLVNDELLDDISENSVEHESTHQTLSTNYSAHHRQSGVQLTQPTDELTRFRTEASVAQVSNEEVRDDDQGKPENEAAPQRSPNEIPLPENSTYLNDVPADDYPLSLVTPLRTTEESGIDTAADEGLGTTQAAGSHIVLQSRDTANEELRTPEDDNLAPHRWQPHEVATNPTLGETEAYGTTDYYRYDGEDGNLQEHDPRYDDHASVSASAPAMDEEEWSEHYEDLEESNGKRPIPTVLIDIKNYSRMSLFPPSTEHPSLKDFVDYPAAIPNGDLAYGSLEAVFAALRTLIGDRIAGDQKLGLWFPQLGLDISEDSIDCSSCTFEELSSLFHTLMFNDDGIDEPQPLVVRLSFRYSFSGGLRELHRAAKEQKGLCDVHFAWPKYWDECGVRPASDDDQAGYESYSPSYDGGSGQSRADQMTHSDDGHDIEQLHEQNTNPETLETVESVEDDVDTTYDHEHLEVASAASMARHSHAATFENEEAEHEDHSHESLHSGVDSASRGGSYSPRNDEGDARNDPPSGDDEGFPDRAAVPEDTAAGHLGDEHHHGEVDHFNDDLDQVEAAESSGYESFSNMNGDRREPSATAATQEAGSDGNFPALVEQRHDPYDDQYNIDYAEDLDTGSATVVGDYGDEEGSNAGQSTVGEAVTEPICTQHMHGSADNTLDDGYDIDWSIDEPHTSAGDVHTPQTTSHDVDVNEPTDSHPGHATEENLLQSAHVASLIEITAVEHNSDSEDHDNSIGKKHRASEHQTNLIGDDDHPPDNSDTPVDQHDHTSQPGSQGAGKPADDIRAHHDDYIDYDDDLEDVGYLGRDGESEHYHDNIEGTREKAEDNAAAHDDDELDHAGNDAGVDISDDTAYYPTPPGLKRGRGHVEEPTEQDPKRVRTA